MVKSPELLKAFVHDSAGTLKFVREELGRPIYLADIQIHDDGSISVRSEALCKELDAHKASPMVAAAKPCNCICGKGC